MSHSEQRSIDVAAPPTGSVVVHPRAPAGTHLRHWRQLRHLSQQELAGQAGISARHLSCMETGRSAPSREMVLRLAERLAVPLRERNRLLEAAGYAPMYRERSLADPALAQAREAVDLVLRSHAPNPALAVDRHWNLLAANAAVAPLLEGIDPALLAAPMNVLRVSLHPNGLARRLVNLNQWRTHLFERLRQQIAVTADPVLTDLLVELQAYPAADGGEILPGEHLGVAMPFRLATPAGVLSFISTTTVFGSPVDITLQEMAIETFFPADAFTTAVINAGVAPVRAINPTLDGANQPPAG